MPVKRRASKTRISPAAELAAWSDVFETGFDFFGELEPFGFNGAMDADRAARAAAPEAWQRLGGMFLDQWKPNGTLTIPWAQEQFGDPRCQ